MSQGITTPGRQARILVVDDDEAIQELIATTLIDEGYQATTAPHGAAALKLIDEPPDLILLDMRMPVMDGWQFAQAYRAGPGPHAPIIVLTAARDAAGVAAQIGAVAYLPKPFLLDDLLDLVNRTLDHKECV